MNHLSVIVRRARKALLHMPVCDVLRVVAWSWLLRTSPIRVCINGISLLVRPGTSDLIVAFSSLVDGEYSQLELHDASGIIDGGANIGTSAISFARKYPDATVIAIEPESDNFSLLKENVKPWSNIKPMNAALAGVDSRRPLLNRGTGPWGYTITDSQQSSRELGQIVDCFTITTVMERFGMETVDILKLDIEGGEKDVLENSSKWIDKVRVLVAELHDRIIPGCEKAFNDCTKSFARKVRVGEKVVAMR